MFKDFKKIVVVKDVKIVDLSVEIIEMKEKRVAVL